MHMKSAAVLAVLLCWAATATAASWCGIPVGARDPLRGFLDRKGVVRTGPKVEVSAAFLKQRLVFKTGYDSYERRGDPFNSAGVWSVKTRYAINCKIRSAKLLSMLGHDIKGTPLDEPVSWSKSDIEAQIPVIEMINASCDVEKPRKHLSCTPFSFRETEVFRPSFAYPGRSERKEADTVRRSELR